MFELMTWPDQFAYLVFCLPSITTQSAPMFLAALLRSVWISSARYSGSLLTRRRAQSLVGEVDVLTMKALWGTVAEQGMVCSN